MLIVLSVNEAKHVRMRDAHHSHVRTASHTTLLHYIAHLIDDVHERHWTRRHTGRRAHHRSVWPEKLIRHTRATARLVNGCRRFRMVHYSRQRVGNVQNKAGCELAVWLAGIDETGSVGNKLPRQHDGFHGRVKLVSFFTGFRL